MTHQRTLTAAHWGVYEVEYDDKGEAAKLHPFSHDPDPSPIGLHMLSDEVARLRVRRPAFRKSWLERGPAANSDKRGQEPFVELPWDEALDLVAGELARVKTTHSNRAIFGIEPSALLGKSLRRTGNVEGCPAKCRRVQNDLASGDFGQRKCGVNRRNLCIRPAARHVHDNRRNTGTQPGDLQPVER